MFNPAQFLKSTTTEAGSTKIVQVPVGDNYVAQIKAVDFRQAIAGEKAKNPGQTITFCDITFKIDDAAVRAATERDEPTSRMSMIVDVSADGQSLDMGKGKNVTLNRVRDAVGQNNQGQAWSPEMLIGQLCRVNVRPQKNDPEYNEVASVVKLG